MKHRRYGNPDANQADIVAFARRRLGLLQSVNTTAVGGGFGDQVVGFAGLTIIVEIKGKTGKRNDDQERFAKDWPGGPVLLVRSAEDLFQQLIDLDKRTPPVRGLPADFRKQVTDALAATAEAVDDEAVAARPSPRAIPGAPGLPLAD